MKHKIITIAVLASLLIVSCARAPEPLTPKLAIMVESNIIEAGSSFTVSGSNFKPGQKVWVGFEYRAIDSSGSIYAYSDSSGGMQFYCEADENGSIHPIFEVPEDLVSGDYEVEVFTGENLYERGLIATLPIHIQGVYCIDMETGEVTPNKEVAK